MPIEFDELIDILVRIARWVEIEFHLNGDDVNLFDEPGRRSLVERLDLLPLDVDLHHAIAADGYRRQEVVERDGLDFRFVTEEASGQSGTRVVVGWRNELVGFFASPPNTSVAYSLDKALWSKVRELPDVDGPRQLANVRPVRFDGEHLRADERRRKRAYFNVCTDVHGSRARVDLKQSKNFADRTWKLVRIHVFRCLGDVAINFNIYIVTPPTKIPASDLLKKSNVYLYMPVITWQVTLRLAWSR